MACGGRHLRGGGALLGLDVAEAAPEVGLGGVEGGRARLQRLHDAGVLFLGQREGAGVRCRTCWVACVHRRTCWVACVRRRSCVGEAGLHVLEGDGTDPGLEGGVHAVSYLMETPEVSGRSARVVQKGPRWHRGIRA